MSATEADMDELRGRLAAVELLAGTALVLALAASQDPKAVAAMMAAPPESFDQRIQSERQRIWAKGMYENMLKCAVDNAVKIKMAAQAVPAVPAPPRLSPPGRN